MTTTLQPIQELEDFYRNPDPWNYRAHPDDARRKSELLSLLPPREWTRALDIGCGDGFITFDLPGQKVVGADISASAVKWADEARGKRHDHHRFDFRCTSIFDLRPQELGTFDLVIVTGVLYSQYIGKAFSVARQRIDALLQDGGVLVSCHIDEWRPPAFPYISLDVAFYPYRGYTHRLETYLK